MQIPAIPTPAAADDLFAMERGILHAYGIADRTLRWKSDGVMPVALRKVFDKWDALANPSLAATCFAVEPASQSRRLASRRRSHRTRAMTVMPVSSLNLWLSDDTDMPTSRAMRSSEGFLFFVFSTCASTRDKRLPVRGTPKGSSGDGSSTVPSCPRRDAVRSCARMIIA